MKGNILVKVIGFGVMFLLPACPSLAQPDEFGDPDNPVPIHGLGLLLLAGGILGVKRIIQRRKK